MVALILPYRFSLGELPNLVVGCPEQPIDPPESRPRPFPLMLLVSCRSTHPHGSRSRTSRVYLQLRAHGADKLCRLEGRRQTILMRKQTSSWMATVQCSTNPDDSRPQAKVMI